MSLNRRKWFWKGEESRWYAYRRIYVVIVLLLASPATIMSMIKQHINGQVNLGCSSKYEKLGPWYEVFFTEVAPITAGFLFNLVIYFLVRDQMRLKAFPQSVRKRRRRIQYYYIIACIICWTPTIVFYMLQLCSFTGSWMVYVEDFSRCTLYLSGFFNFLIFGTSDPHLKRSLMVIAYYLGISCCYDSSVIMIPPTDPSHEPTFLASEALRQHSSEKTVMFSGAISNKADTAHSKLYIYNLLLSREQKAQLYRVRPDLDPKAPFPQRPVGFAHNDIPEQNPTKLKSILKKTKNDGTSSKSTSTKFSEPVQFKSSESVVSNDSSQNSTSIPISFTLPVSRKE
jgi:hypothetical protein